MSRRGFIAVFAVMLVLFISKTTFARPGVKISIFNFDTLNIESAGYGTTVSNMLATSLKSSTHFDLMDRKELEAFLRLNDLQQNDDIKNIIQIGNRLGLYAVIAGTVEKTGSIINIKCKVIQIDRQKIILRSQTKSIGDAGLISETSKLSALITQAISNSINQQGEQEATGIGEPVDIQARSGGNSRIYITWKDPPGQKASGYKIFRSLSNSGPFAKIAQITKPEYLDEYLETKTVYHYKIRSYDSRGRQSSFSKIIFAETAPTPNPPIILKTVPHVLSIEITWSPSPVKSEDPNELKGYKLYRAKVEGGPYDKVATILGRDIGLGAQATTTLDKLLKVTYTDKNLADGEAYFYKVTAYDVKNLESDFSAPVRGTTIPIVGNLSARGDMIREIEISWDQIVSPHIKGYYIYRSLDAKTGFNKIQKIDSPISNKTGRMRFIDDQGLGDKITYFYQVTAYENSDMETSPSATVSATTRGKPPIVKGFQAKTGMVKMVDLSWQVNDEDEVKGYKIYRSQDTYGTYAAIKEISGRTNDRFADKNLDDNGTYCYRITTFNKVDVESEMSDAVCVTTKPRPEKPTGLQGSSLQVKKVPLKWLPNKEQDIILYYVYRSSDGGNRFSKIESVEGKTQYIDEKLEDGHEYRYKIQARDKDDLLSDFSEIISVTTKAKPKKPEGLNGHTEGGGKIILNWSPNSETDIAHYVIYEKSFLALTKVSTVTSNNVTISGLPQGKKKVYVVTAVNKDELESEPSEPVEVLIE